MRLSKAREHSAKRSGTENTVNPYWWSNEINQQRKQCNRRRRKVSGLSRHVNGEEAEKAKIEYKDAKRELCEYLKNDILGDGYRLEINRLQMVAPYDIPSEKTRENVVPYTLETGHR